MGFDDWMNKRTFHYKGFMITPGSIRRDGEAVVLMLTRMGASPKEVYEQGREAIEQHLAAKKSICAP